MISAEEAAEWMSQTYPTEIITEERFGLLSPQAQLIERGDNTVVYQLGNHLLIKYYSYGQSSYFMRQLYEL